jgi:hypothetical protein
MEANVLVKIGTALFKHRVRKLLGEETLGILSQELSDAGADVLNRYLSGQATGEAIQQAALTARDSFRNKINDEELEQWMIMLPLHTLPTVLSAIDELPTSPDEKKLESALRESILQNWRKLSPEQVDHAVHTFLAVLRSALLPVEKQTLMVLARSTLRAEEKLDRVLAGIVQLMKREEKQGAYQLPAGLASISSASQLMELVLAAPLEPAVVTAFHMAWDEGRKDFLLSTAHLFLGLLLLERGMLGQIIRECGDSVPGVEATLRKSIQQQPETRDVKVTYSFRQTVERALELAKQSGSPPAEIHFLVSLMDIGQNLLRYLQECGFGTDRWKNEIRRQWDKMICTPYNRKTSAGNP